MDAASLLASLTAAGFALKPRSGALMISPASKLGPEQKAAIKACRAELLALVVAQQPPSCPYCHRALAGAKCWRCCISICECGTPTMSAFLAVCRGCEVAGYRERGQPY